MFSFIPHFSFPELVAQLLHLEDKNCTMWTYFVYELFMGCINAGGWSTLLVL